MSELDHLRLILGVLGVWRVTHLLHAEFGPWRLLEILRQGVTRILGTRLFDCFYCLSLWVAVPFGWVLGATWSERMLVTFACSGGAILLERLTYPSRLADLPVPPAYVEGKEAEHELLHSSDT